MLVALGLIALGGLTVLGLNLAVILPAASAILPAHQVQPAQCAIVPGCLVYDGGALSAVLKDRMDAAIELYQGGKVKRLLLSGDHGRRGYDEVNAMRVYAEQQGVPSEDIFLDHAGFTTYDTMARARRIFCVESAVVVTNRFHLARAVFLARSVGIRAQGVVADRRRYLYAEFDEQREALARCKAVYSALFQPDPDLLGDPIPITGDARLTHDRKEPGRLN